MLTVIMSLIDLNAVMRRIDLLAKLLAPVFVSVIDEYSTFTAISVVFAQNILSVTIEYFAIAQVGSHDLT